VVVSSTCQLYSGTGTALFDWIRHAREALDFAVLIDVGVRRNYDIIRAFCRDQRIALLPSAPMPIPGCPDYGVADVEIVLRSRRWDYVECISWANAATNLAVLENRPADTMLLYTPHTQPRETLQGFEQFHSVEPVFDRMLREADAVFIDSPRELAPYEDRFDPADRVHHVYLGVNDEVFVHRDGEVRNRIVCLGDFAEARKRIDLVLGAFARCLQDDPGLKLEIAGDRSRDLDLPRRVARNMVRHGYLDQPTLVRLIQESKVLLQLSDYEAFGLPIAEALCCGTPVVIPDQETLRDIFGDLPGVALVPQKSADAVAEAVARVPVDTSTRRLIAAEAGRRFSFARTYGRKLQIVQSLARRRRS
jgi:glycosyltransferase involved in cell wall biosynthesis